MRRRRGSFGEAQRRGVNHDELLRQLIDASLSQPDEDAVVTVRLSDLHRAINDVAPQPGGLMPVEAWLDTVVTLRYAPDALARRGGDGGREGVERRAHQW